MPNHTLAPGATRPRTAKPLRALSAALLAVYVFSLEHLGITAEIDELFVLSSQGDRGIGAELLEVAESEFRRLGCTNVSLQLS